MKSRNPFFIIIYFCFFLSLIFLAIFAVKNINFKNLAKNKDTKTTEIKATSKSLNSPADKQIVITNTEIDTIIANYGGEYIVDAKTTIDSSGIKTTGTAKKFFNQDATATIVPTILDSQLQLNIKSLKVGPVSAPKWAYDKLSDTINSKIKSSITKEMKINSIVLGDNILTIKGR